MTTYLSDTTKGPVTHRSSQGHRQPTLPARLSHYSGHEKGQGPPPSLDPVMLEWCSRANILEGFHLA